MFAKIAVLACALAVAQAGVISSPVAYSAGYAAPAYSAGYAAPAYGYAAAPVAYASPTLTATSDNVYRSAGNLNTISTHTKSIATPFSSSNKQFTSITNPGIYAQTAYAAPAYAAPVAHAAYAAPVAHAAYAAPVAHAGYAAPAVAHGSSLLGVAYSPAVAVSHMAYSSPIGINYSY